MIAMLKFNAAMHALWNSPFIANVAKLATGGALAQVIALACAPILTRLYTPEDFGLLGVFSAIVAVISVTATLRYDLAIILPPSNTAAWALLKFIGKITLVIVIALSLVTFPFRSWFANLLRVPGLDTYYILLPLVVLGAGWGSLAANWALRGKQFGALAKTSVSSSLAGNGFKIGAGTLGFGGGSLIIALIVQQWFRLIVLSRILWKTIPHEVAEDGEALKLAKQYSEFPKYRMLQDGLSILANQLPNILLAIYFSPLIVGFYLLTVRVLQAPSSIIKDSVGKAFYQQAAETKNRKGNLLKLNDRMTLVMLGIMVLPVFTFCFLGPTIFTIIFGDEWAIAGQYSQYIIFMIALSFANVPGVSAVTAIGRNKQLLGFGVFSMIARSGAIIIGGMYFSPLAAIAIYALTCALKDIALIIWCRYALVQYQKSV